MRPDDKRKQTSRLNALKSTGPKTPEGKRRSAFNSVTHAAYVQEFILPGEELPHFQLLMDTHLDTWKPTNPIEETFVLEMATTLWRLRRQAPAESNLINIQIQRMLPGISQQYESVSPSALYALAVVALQENGDALNQITRQGRRLLSQYEKLTQQLLTMRQLFPPANLNPQSDLDPQSVPGETNLTDDQPTDNQPGEKETVETQLIETPVETNLTSRQRPGSVLSANTRSSITHHLPVPRETRAHNPHSILYAALPPIAQLTQPEAPAKTHTAMGSTSI